MAWDDKIDQDDGIEDSHQKIVEGGLRKSSKRKTVRNIDTPFIMPNYGGFINMSQLIKIPRQRNVFLREAFFKCYFRGISTSEEGKTPEEALRIFAKLFYYHQEVRIETRKFFDRFNKEKLKENEYSALKEYVERWVIDGCKTISTMPIPKPDFKNYPNRDNFEDEEQFLSAAENFAKGTDHIKITFNPKKRDFPQPDELFLGLAGKNAGPINEKNGDRFISFLELDHSTSNYISISGKLWTQAFALLVRDALEELELEIQSTGVLYAYIPQLNIKAAIDHFSQNYPRSIDMDKNEMAYSISHRYKNKISDKPYIRESILRELNRKEKSA